MNFKIRWLQWHIILLSYLLFSSASWSQSTPLPTNLSEVSLNAPKEFTCPHHAPPLSDSEQGFSTPSQGSSISTGDTTSTASSKQRKSVTKAKKWPTDKLRFVTKKGTWMDVSVSPDGKRVVFDILGDLYIVGIKGGKSKHLTKGHTYDSQPQWSPDGKSILFTSDRGGRTNAWLIHPNGKGLRKLSQNKWGQLNSPIWRPDGMFYVYRKRITDRRSVGVVELWMHHILGGKGFQLTKGNQVGDANDPAFSPDGRYIYFAARGRHRYNRNVHSGIWNILRLDIQTKRRLLITRNGSRPTPSPDGKWLAIIRRIGHKTAIVLHHLSTGKEHTLLNYLDRDDQEGFAVDNTYPSIDWTPDSQELVYTAQGKLWRTSIQNQKRVAIPFTAQIEQDVRRALLFTRRIGQRKFPVKMLRWVKLAPSHKRIFFGALGHIWTATYPKVRNIRRLTQDNHHLEFAPAISPNGQSIAYVSWTDKQRGFVWLRDLKADGSVGPPYRVTKQAGYYANPSFSPDGQRLAFVKASGSEARGLGMSWQPWQQIVQVSLEQELPTSKLNKVVTLRNHGALSHMPQAQFSLDGKRIYFTRVKSKRYKRYTILCSRRLDGTVEQQYVSIYAGEDLQVSPDGKWLLFRHLHHIYLTVMPPPRQQALPLRINNGAYRGSPLPVLHLSKGYDGGNWPNWNQNHTIVWSLGQTLYTLPFSKAKSALFSQTHPPKKAKQTKKAKQAKKKPKLLQKKLPYTETKLSLMGTNPQPKGWLALTGLRIISMKGKQVISKGTILIHGHRIKRVGKEKEVVIPKGTKVINLEGKTAIPGMIDVHAHMHYGALDIHPEQSWSYKANFAYGVTTIHDPSASTELVFSQGERVRAGKMVGPRIFSTGFILYGAENTHKAVIRTRQDAVHHIRRLKRLGAWSVKSYMQPTRQQRQWIMEAARQEKLLVFPEGGGRLDMNLSMILDGHTGIEHALPYASLYPDVVKLFAFSKTGYTPTLLVSYGGVFGENYFYQKYPAWNNKKLKRWMPARILAAKSRRRSTSVLDNDWHYKQVAAGAYAVVKAGGRVQIGSHGQLQGLGYHWEMLALHNGGMPVHDVLRAATLHGAVYLGLDKDLGSIEPGKIADIVILSKNPLEKMIHSTKIHSIVKNGFIYDAKTLLKQNP